MAETGRPLASLRCGVAQSAPHRIVVCTSCKHRGTPCEPGFRLLQRLREAIAAANPGEEFEVAGTACLAGCVSAHGAPCLVGWRATARATWLFGDIDPDQSLEDLVAFANSHAAPDDGRSMGRDPPHRPRTTTLARIPAAIIVTRAGVVQ